MEKGGGIKFSKLAWQGCRILLFVLASVLYAGPGTDYKIERGLMDRLANDDDATAPFFVVFGERADLTPAYRISDRQARARFVAQALQAVANRSQAGVRGYLQGRRVTFTAFWIENKIFVREGTLELARALAQRPDVVAILAEVVYTIPQPQAAAIQSVEWNISKIRADQVWPTTKGAGIVVANIDTGVQYTHPALVNQYRGNTGGGFNHTGNWNDPTGICGSVPCDNNGHGTHTMGTMVGDDGAGNQVGVAPGAKWIACKGCATSSCAGSDLITCAQWIVAPGGSGPPHAVNNSWGGGGGNSWYQSYVQAWVAAGIMPAFSNGNSGPNCNTAGSPGDYPESFASGATDITDTIASFSSRGPSTFGGIKPNVSAPGVSVRSSYPTSTYATLSGTSMASPHTAGATALIWAAAPAFVGNVSGTEQVMRDTAVVLTTSQTCGGIPAGASPNNTYGYGRIDALAAVNKVKGGPPPNLPPTVTITAPANGSSFNCPVTVNFTGTASDPEDGSLTSVISWTDNGTGFGTGGSPSKSYACTDAGNHNIVASATDSAGSTATSTITITIVNSPLPAAPSNLTAAVSGSTVNLKWQDNSDNESYFIVERTPKGQGLWTQIGNTGASNIVTFTNNPGKGNWSYRVRAHNSAGNSASSNVVSARIR